MLLDSKDIPKEELMNSICKGLVVTISAMDVHLFGNLIIQLIKKCKIKGVLEFLESCSETEKRNVDQEMENEILPGGRRI